MKSYICSILLLIYGLAHFATQVRGDCQFGNEVLKVGLKKIPPCGGIVCEPNGQIHTVKCPELERYQCKSHENHIGFLDENPDKPFPNCCPRAICANRLFYEFRYPLGIIES